jgi:hypothetical protein
MSMGEPEDTHAPSPDGREHHSPAPDTDSSAQAESTPPQVYEGECNEAANPDQWCNGVEAAKVLRRLIPRDRIQIVTLDPKIGGISARTFSKDEEVAMATHIEQSNTQGQNVHFSVNEVSEAAEQKKAKRQDITAFRAVWEDIDPDKELEVEPGGYDRERKRLLETADWLASCDYPPTLIIDSGNGIQTFWFLKEPQSAGDETDARRYQTLQRAFHEALGGPDFTGNADRTMRVPNTINYPNASKRKRGRDNTQARVIHESRAVYSLEELEAIAPYLEAELPHELRSASGQTSNTARRNDQAEGNATDAEIDAFIRELQVNHDWGSFEKDPDLKRRFEETLEKHPKFRRRWEGGTDEMSGDDRSHSAMDFSLAALSRWAGFSDIDTATILNEFKHGRARDEEANGGHEGCLRHIARCIKRASGPRQPLDVELIKDALAKMHGGGPAASSGNGEPPASVFEPPGLVGMIASYCNSITHRDVPLFGTVAGLVAVSTLAANQFVVSMPGGPTPLNLYVLLLAATGVGKETPRRVCYEILQTVDEFDAVTQAASDVGLLRKLQSRQNILWMPDEFGHYLRFAAGSSGGHQYAMMSLIMQLYGLALSTLPGRTYANGAQNIPAIALPYVSVLATSTPLEVVKAMTNSEVVNGTLNRFITFIEDDKAAPFKDGPAGVMDKELREQAGLLAKALIIRMKLFYEEKKEKPKRVSIVPQKRPAIFPTNEAVKILIAFRDEADRLRASSDETAPIWARAYENAIRVAGVIAFGDYDPQESSNPTLTASHAEWAVQLLCWTTRRTAGLVKDEIGDSETERDAKKVLAFVREVIAQPPTGNNPWLDLNRRGLVARSQVVKKFQRIEKWRRDALLNSLVEGGLLEERKEKLNSHSHKETSVFSPLLMNEHG